VKRQCWSLINEESQSLAVEGKAGHQEIYQLTGRKCDQKRNWREKMKKK